MTEHPQQTKADWEDAKEAWGSFPQPTKKPKRKTRKQLFAMADEKGFIYSPGRKTPTLWIHEDGTILRADTDLSLCIKMTVAEAFQTLGKTIK
jgi:hypothetical protein